MSSRYGSKTRTTEPVAGYGQRATAGGGSGRTFTEERFLSPGTWTRPPTVSFVEVLVVGGGGGGQGALNNPVTGLAYRAGGGGGVRVAWVPVSAPVPVTVGSGGAGGTYPSTTSGSNGGNSFFGPAGPGPIPAIPSTTIAAGGGAGGGQPQTTVSTPIGGSGGGGSTFGGALGRANWVTSMPNYGTAGSGAGSSNQGGVPGLDLYGFGAGGGGSGSEGFNLPRLYADVSAHHGGGMGCGDVWNYNETAQSGLANHGGGGGGGTNYTPTQIPTAPRSNGGNGGSGIVIVRYLA